MSQFLNNSILGSSLRWIPEELTKKLAVNVYWMEWLYLTYAACSSRLLLLPPPSSDFAAAAFAGFDFPPPFLLTPHFPPNSRPFFLARSFSCLKRWWAKKIRNLCHGWLTDCVSPASAALYTRAIAWTLLTSMRFLSRTSHDHVPSLITTMMSIISILGTVRRGREAPLLTHRFTRSLFNDIV